MGSWTEDNQIKQALSVRINSTSLITEMLFGDLSGADLVFGFRKPEDLTLQDRFCIAIMKNHPDREIREHVRKELLRGDITIIGVDLTKPDPLYRKRYQIYDLQRPIRIHFSLFYRSRMGFQFRKSPETRRYVLPRNSPCILSWNRLSPWLCA